MALHSDGLPGTGLLRGLWEPRLNPMRAYTVDMTFEVTTTDYDPYRLARMATRFARLLPDGSQTQQVSSAVDSVAALAAQVPAESPITALRAVVTALELAATEEPGGLDTLGAIRRATVDLVAAAG